MRQLRVKHQAMPQFTMHFPKFLSAGCVFLLAACAGPAPQVPSPAPAAFGSTQKDRPDNAPPGTCWGNTITPAVIETTTERILVAPADISPEGTIRTPARYRNEDRQTILRPRQVTWHEILCPDLFTPDFIASLQRALSARGLHQGSISGLLDTPTKDAIARYQTDQNLPGYDLSKEAAQRLGLIVAPQI